MDAVFKALADASRRQLLDSLSRRGGQSQRQLCADLAMTRQAVSKHLAVLEDAGLVATVRRGREKLHYLNPVPSTRSTNAGSAGTSRAGSRPSATSRPRWKKKPFWRNRSQLMSETTFVYVTYIRTTPEKLWQARQ
jgi:DNA-binding transcriptional ArsR family regulator